MKSKKLLYILAAVLCIQIFAPIAVHAGEWVEDQKGWRWQLSRGGYLKGCWWYIEDEWYYFHSNGYMAHDRWIGNYYVGSDGAMYRSKLTPDGYMVNGDGHWMKDYYCTNPDERFPAIIEAYVHSMKDRGSYYEAITSLYPVPELQGDVIGYETIFRIEKNAEVYDLGYHDKNEKYDFSEYIKKHQIFPIYHPEFDKNGHIIYFAVVWAS